MSSSDLPPYIALSWKILYITMKLPNNRMFRETACKTGVSARHFIFIFTSIMVTLTGTRNCHYRLCLEKAATDVNLTYDVKELTATRTE